MNEYLERQVMQILEEMRTNMIQAGKAKNLDWVSSEKSITGIFESHLYLYASHFITEIANNLGINRELAESLFGKAKAAIYDKYSK